MSEDELRILKSNIESLLVTLHQILIVVREMREQLRKLEK